MDEAIAYLAELQVRLTDAERQHRADSEQRFEIAISEQLEKLYPFSELAGKFVSDGKGGGHSTRGLAGNWALSQLRLGNKPDFIVAEAEKDIQNNSIEVVEVTPIRGIRSDVTEVICADMCICPNRELPPSHYNDLFFSDAISPFRVRDENAAAVQKFRISPLLVEEGNLDRHISLRDQRQHERKLLLLALILSCSAPVSMPMSYMIVTGSGMLKPMATFGGTIEQPTVVATTAPNYNLVRENLWKVRNFADEKLWLAIERLGRARLNFNPVDEAIDYGLAMEIALINEENAFGGISSRIRSRAGWLLGADPEQRLSKSDIAGLIYDARCDAAHSGRFKKRRVIDNFKPAEADKFVTDLLSTILHLGNFPDWSRLSFGGAP